MTGIDDQTVPQMPTDINKAACPQCGATSECIYDYPGEDGWYDKVAVYVYPCHTCGADFEQTLMFRLRESFIQMDGDES